MIWGPELTTRGTPRKIRLRGFDPMFAVRVPVPLIEAIKAQAAERKVPYSVVVREALSRYVEGEAA
jgi:predicted DNA binding CopG/RHH family protein